jgi:hypothetical protein
MKIVLYDRNGAPVELAAVVARKLTACIAEVMKK